MRKFNILLLSTLVSLILFVSCDPSITTPIGTGKLGSLGASKDAITYVAIGTSITAGYMDGGVYAAGQQYSFPNLLAGKLGLNNFVQPEIADPGLGENLMKFRGFTSTGSPIIDKTFSFSPTGVINAATYAKPFSNLGVPGAIVYDLIDTSDYGARAKLYGNPYYSFFLRSSLFGKSVIDQAIALNPTFITIDMGANDVLTYAGSGGTVSTSFDDKGNAIPTPAEQLFGIYSLALTKLTKALPNAKIILLNVPEVTGTPHFTTVPWNALVLDEAKSAALNAAYKGLVKFVVGPNGFIVEDPKSPFKMRQLTDGDAILLRVPQDSLPLGMGSIKPIPKKYVLFKDEIALVKSTVDAYNTKINTLSAISTNIKVFDLNAVFKTVLGATGYAVPGSSAMTAKYISGETFSLDGIHPTARGYGAVTNELIRFINQNYGSDIPMVLLQNLPATVVR